MEDYPAKAVWNSHLTASNGDIGLAIARTRKSLLTNEVMLELFAENMLMNLWQEELRRREIQ